MPRYPWIVFDADQTLFDFDRAERTALATTLADFGEPCDDRVHRRYLEISAELWGAYQRGEIDPARLRIARFELLLDGRPSAAVAGRVSAAYLEALIEASDLLPGAAEVVVQLARAHVLVLATNGISDVQRRRLARTTIASSFRHVVVSDEVGAPKPQTRFFDEVHARLGRPDRSRVLVVGDSLETDVAGARAFGFDACWIRAPRVAAAASPTPRPAPGLEPTHEIDALGQLLELVA